MSKTKKISLYMAVAFAVGAMIGGGVFVLSGDALMQTGPSAITSFLIAAVIVLFSALSFSVIASQVSDESPGYTFVGKSLGSPQWSFMTSWCFYLSGIIATAFVLNAFGTYMHDFILPQLSILGWSLIGATVLTLVNLGPASEIGKVESILVTVKILILLVLVTFGLLHFHTSALHPFTPHGISQVFGTSAFLFIAFLGFNVITSISNDIDNPRKTVPKAIILSMLIVTLIYCGVAIALLSAHLSSYSEASVGVAAQHLIGPIGGGLIIVGAIFSTLSSANANILGSSEIMVRLAANREVPTILGRLKKGHPIYSVLAAALLYFILLLSGQTKAVIDLANVTAIVALIIVNFAAAKAQRSKSFQGLKLPGRWCIPILGAIGAASQFFFMPKTTLLIGLILTFLGFVIYDLRGRSHLPKLHQQLKGLLEDVEGPLGRALSRS